MCLYIYIYTYIYIRYTYKCMKKDSARDSTKKKTSFSHGLSS